MATPTATGAAAVQAWFQTAPGRLFAVRLVVAVVLGVVLAVLGVQVRCNIRSRGPPPSRPPSPCSAGVGVGGGGRLPNLPGFTC